MDMNARAFYISADDKFKACASLAQLHSKSKRIRHYEMRADMIASNTLSMLASGAISMKLSKSILSNNVAR